jgi:hypothetical protein
MSGLRRRKAVESLERTRNATIAGVWGNPNYDPQKEGDSGHRSEFLEKLQERHMEKIAEMYDPDRLLREQLAAEEDYATNPFFRNARRMEMLAEKGLLGPARAMHST